VNWGVGLTDPLTGAVLRVVPNVSDGRFEVQFEATSGNASLAILDAAGRVVEVLTELGSRFNRPVDLSEVGAGVYMVEVKWSGKVLKERVVVMGR
jgi:hypothetical protein